MAQLPCSFATVTGADSGNYTLNVPAGVLGDVLKKELLGTVTVAAKSYDGGTAATGSVSLAGAVAGDTVEASGTVLAFADKNAGTGKTVNVSGTMLTGGDAGNYRLTISGPVKGDILKRALSIAAIDAQKQAGDPDPALGYTLLSGSLVAGDVLSGGANRAAGEQAGDYVIDIGSLSAGTNCEIQFRNGVFTIRPLERALQAPVQPFRSVTLPTQLPNLNTGPEDGAVTIDSSAVCGENKSCVSESR